MRDKQEMISEILEFRIKHSCTEMTLSDVEKVLAAIIYKHFPPSVPVSDLINAMEEWLESNDDDLAERIHDLIRQAYAAT